MHINNYEWDPEVHKLAEGGFAEVFKAQDVHKPGRWVALKIYKESVDKGSSLSDGNKYTLEREFSNIDGLSHTNLITYYGLHYLEGQDNLGRKASYPVIAMELAEEGTLVDFMSTRPDENTKEKIIRDIVSGVSYLHSQGIIHRDLKPGNILISRDRLGNVLAKITDFGISRDTLSANAIEQSITHGIGTPHYMSPEQFAPKRFGLEGVVSRHTDIWSVGVIAYWVLTRSRPFGQGSNQFEEVRDEILETEPDLDKLPEQYVKSIAGLLSKRPEERSLSFYGAEPPVNCITELHPKEELPDTQYEDHETIQHNTIHREEEKTQIIEEKTQLKKQQPNVHKEPKALSYTVKPSSSNLKWIIITMFLLVCGITALILHNKLQAQKLEDAWNKTLSAGEVPDFNQFLQDHRNSEYSTLALEKRDSVILAINQLNLNIILSPRSHNYFGDTLFVNCGNVIYKSIEGLESFNMDFTANGADIEMLKDPNYLNVIPRKEGNLRIECKIQGVLVRGITFNSTTAPSPQNIEIYSNNKLLTSYDQRLRPVSRNTKSISMKIVPDVSFRNWFPREAQYRVTKAEVSLIKVNGVISVVSETMTGADEFAFSQSVTDYLANPENGGYFKVKVIEVKRRNSKNEIEIVNNLAFDRTFNIPFN